MKIVDLFKSIFQPVVDTAIASEKPQAEALVISMGAKVEAAVAAAVGKHTDPATTALIMAEVDVELTAVETEINADIENFRIKL